MALKLSDIKKNKEVLAAIRESDKALEILGYTEHGLRHLDVVSDRAQEIAKSIGMIEREIELSGMAAFCHDMGNFMGRTKHHYWAAILFRQIFGGAIEPDEMVTVMQAIANHDKEEMKFTNKVSAVLVIADKSDVHQSRVRNQPIEQTMMDIHDRVNYAVTDSSIKVDRKEKTITLALTINTDLVSIIEYFEIFTERMSYCRKAAEYLGYKFSLVMNDFKLS
ncbi:MAG: HD domain-containing protein [Patescibacteria group bacterium]|nr:HD domain-containing protein [Patescibacteria group bacterium]